MEKILYFLIYLVAAATILFWIHKSLKIAYSFLIKFYRMYLVKIWIVSSLDEETIQGEETIQYSTIWGNTVYILLMFFAMFSNSSGQGDTSDWGKKSILDWIHTFFAWPTKFRQWNQNLRTEINWVK